MQPITLCLIAKDEAAWIAGALESVRGLVDRAIVVDTGSQDRTREIALEAGARVIEHRWQDDFAAARNAALEHVRDGFILVLDADERLGSEGQAVVRAAVGRDDFDCGLLPLHNARSLDALERDVLSGAERRGEPVLLPRLLRRTPDLAWEGIVHETVGAWVTRGARRIARIEAPIVHYGAVPELRAERGKDRRNLELLERRVSSAPADAIARTYLAREYERSGASARAREEARRAWQDLSLARTRGESPDSVACATLLGWLELKHDDLGRARTLLDEAERVEPDHPNLLLLRGLLEERSALGARDQQHLALHLERAEVAYTRCLEQAGRVYATELLPGATDWAAAIRLGTVHLVQNKPSEALREFDLALARQSENGEARLGRCEALILKGEAQLGLTELEPLARGDSPDAWILSALACMQLGAEQDLVWSTGEALRRRATPPIAPHRAELLKALLEFVQGSVAGPMPTPATAPDAPPDPY